MDKKLLRFCQALLEETDGPLRWTLILLRKSQNEVIAAMPNMFSIVLLPWKFTSRM